MGDMADMALEEIWDIDADVVAYQAGQMSFHEAMQRGILCEVTGGLPTGYRPRFGAPKPVRCRYCGARGLYWKSTDKGWRLASKGEVHSCDEYFEEGG